MVAPLGFLLTLFASFFRSKSRLEAENAALRQQLAVLRRKVRGRVKLTKNVRLFLMQSLVPFGLEGNHDRAARNPRALASCGLSPVLALEIPIPRRPAANENRSRPASVNSADEPGTCGR